MKNKYIRQAQYKKGFVVPLLIAIIAVLVIGGGVYIYQSKKITEGPAFIDTDIQQIDQNLTTGIVVEQPTLNQEVQLPITVKGYLNGNGWAAFEGVAGNVQIFDANNKAISAVTLLQATTDWMQPVVNFEATVGDRQMMSNLATQTGVLVFKNEDPKADSNSAREFRLPIKFAAINTTVEKAGGIIKSVYSKSGKNYLDIDYIEWNPNWAPGGGHGSVYQNNNPQIRTFAISPSAKFFKAGDVSMTFLDFQKYFATDAYHGDPWNIVVTNGLVTKITEYFIP